MEPYLLIVFTFGIGIFFALSMVEVPVWKLIFQNRDVPEVDVRFTHEALKKLTSKLPASNGVVILGATVLMILQGNQIGWSALTISQFAIYWGLLLLIIVVLKNPSTVKSIRAHNSKSSLIDLKADLRNVGRDHHIGLVANLCGLILELIIIGGML